MMSNLFVSIEFPTVLSCRTTLAPLGAVGQVKPSGGETSHGRAARDLEPEDLVAASTTSRPP